MSTCFVSAADHAIYFKWRPVLTLVPTPKDDALAVTTDQLDLIRRTIAKDATPDELKLYLYDCQRQGVHPLDKLIHFTKRGGKYTPVTSIDFMRTRAADTGEMAGSDDPVFDTRCEREEFAGPDKRDPHPCSATVTVYRLTQGQRFAYTATARWSEYKPAEDFMWRRMPHTMLGKCAEACALRKGFPRQLAGLYAKEEMDQAGPASGYVVEPPALPEKREKPGGPAGGDTGPSSEGPDLGVDLRAVLIERIDVTDTRNANIQKTLLTVSTGETFSTINSKLAALAAQLCQEKAPVFIESKPTRWGADLVSLTRLEPDHDGDETDDQPVLTDKDIPF